MLDFFKKLLNLNSAESDRRSDTPERKLEVFAKPQFDRRGADRRALAAKPKPPKHKPKAVKFESKTGGNIEDAGPGKNVLVRSRYVREDTGTHETLKILDDSLSESPEEDDLDPYNTGKFDRSKNWDKDFFRK